MQARLLLHLVLNIKKGSIQYVMVERIRSPVLFAIPFQVSGLIVSGPMERCLM